LGLSGEVIFGIDLHENLAGRNLVPFLNPKLHNSPRYLGAEIDQIPFHLGIIGGNVVLAEKDPLEPKIKPDHEADDSPED